MRVIFLTALAVLGFVTAGLAQPASQLEVGPVLRLHKLFIEGGTGGVGPVAGVFTSFRISKRWGVEAELTEMSNSMERSYEGWFYSDAPMHVGPNPTQEEILRWAPTARRTLGYVPGLGWSIAFVVRGQISPRVRAAARVGLTTRRFVETSAYTILSIPEGMDPADVARHFRDESYRLTTVGPVVGLDLSVAVMDHLSVTPEVLFGYGRWDFFKYVELGLGVRAAWRF